VSAWYGSSIPQHHNVPSTRMPQLTGLAESTWAQAGESGKTISGILETSVLVRAVPNRPSSLYPQQYRAPVSFTAQTCRSPPEIMARRALVATCRGMELAVVLPSPSCPWSLLPQHQAFWSA
jgi:hypothetical protein